MVYAVFILFVFFLGNYGSLEQSVTLVSDHISLNYGQLCPYQSFCTTNASKVTSDPDMTSCCQKCSCSPDCYLTGTCCPDMNDIRDKEPKYPCRDLYEFGNGNVSETVTSVQKAGFAFRVIDDCPNIELLRQYPRCMNFSELEDYQLVMDQKQEQIYRNSHCAFCNGINETIAWDLVAKSCIYFSYNNFTTFEERNKYILQKCFIFSIPPKGMEPLSRCYDNVQLVNSCISTLQNSFEVNDLTERCEDNTKSNQNAYFFEDILLLGRVKRIVHANVFCYMCTNGLKPVTNLCDKKAFVHKDKSMRVPFSAVLSWNYFKSRDASVSRTCSVTAVMDPYISQCRPVRCPLGEMPVYGECLPLFQSTEGDSFMLRYDITLLAADEKMHLELNQVAASYPESLFSKIGWAVFNKISAIFKRQNVGCGICNFALWHYYIDSSKRLSFQLQLYTTKQCSFRGIVKMARTFVSMGTVRLQTKVNNSTVHVKFCFTTEHNSSKDQTQVFVYFTKGCDAAKLFTTQMLFDCPFFELNSDEITQVQMNKKTNSDPLNGFIKYNDLYLVCVNNYLSQMSAAYIPLSSLEQFLHRILFSFMFSVIFEIR